MKQLKYSITRPYHYAVSKRMVFTLLSSLLLYIIANAQPTLLMDINPGPNNSLVSNQGSPHTPDKEMQAANYNGYLYFEAYNPNYGYELWRTDGTTASLFFDAFPGGGSSHGYPSSFYVFDNHLYFRARKASGDNTLWKTDGTTTTEVYSTNSLNYTSQSTYAELNGKLYVSGFPKLLEINGNAATPVTDGDGNSAIKSPNYVGSTGSFLYVLSGSSTQFDNGYYLYRTDGTEAGFQPLKELNDNSTGLEAPSPNAEGRYKREILILEDKMIWRTTEMLYVSDGTVAGTGVLYDFFPNSDADGNPKGMVEVGGEIYFSALDMAGNIQSRMWKTDGTTAGTAILNPQEKVISSDGIFGNSTEVYYSFSSEPVNTYVSANIKMAQHDANGTQTLFPDFVVDFSAPDFINNSTYNLEGLAGEYLVYDHFFAGLDEGSYYAISSVGALHLGSSQNHVLFDESKNIGAIFSINNKLVFSMYDDSYGVEFWTWTSPIACTAPDAGFSHTSTGLDVQFTNASTVSSNAAYSWEFGDGNTSPTENPNHTYAAEGNYTVCLIAMDDCGSDTTCQMVTVTNPCGTLPTADFTPSLPFNLQVSLNAYSSSYGNNPSFHWNFGDNNTETKNTPADFLHTYDAPGNYDVCLTVTDDCGSKQHCEQVTINSCVRPTSAFYGNTTPSVGGDLFLSSISSNDSNNGILTHFWDFGNGDTSTDMSPNYSYAYEGSYDLCLIVTDDCGSDTTCQMVTVTCLTPTPAFYPSTDTVEGLQVFFSDQSYLDLSQASYQWEFGDGNTSSAQNPIHHYATEGTYNVCLTITNDCGNDGLICHDITVNGTPEDNDVPEMDSLPSTTLAHDFNLDGCVSTASITMTQSNEWKHFMNGGNIVLSIFDSHPLGEVNVYFNDDNNDIQVENGIEYMPRIFQIVPEHQPAQGLVYVRFYMDMNELNALIAANDGDGNDVDDICDLSISRFSGGLCEATEVPDNGIRYDVEGCGPVSDQIFYLDAGFPGFSSFYMHGGNSALPVELMAFNASTIENDVFLNWATASEENNKGFAIQHSVDGENWENVGYVEGHGNSTEIVEYRFTHHKADAGVHYYRLAQEDFDGTTDLSDIRVVRIGGGQMSIGIYPNPVKGGHTHISFQSLEQTATLAVYDGMGKQVARAELPQGSSGFKLETADWANGVYYVRISQKDQMETLRFLVQ